MKEIWKDVYFEEYDIVYDYRGYYQVSNFGRVKSLERWKPNHNQTGFTGTYKLIEEKILKPKKDKKGYLYVELYKEGKSKTFKIHRLVGIVFIPNPQNKPQVNHKFGDKTQNIVDLDNLYGKTTTLEWATNEENQRHAWKTGLQKPRFGSKNPKAKRIIQYDLNGNFIKEWDCMMEVERQLNINHASVSSCCRNKIKNIKGYIFKYKD